MRPLTEETRNAAAITRERGACIRCRMQRLKVSLVNPVLIDLFEARLTSNQQCLSNPDDRLGPCLTCTKVNRDSPKVIHKQICYRVKITDVAIFLPQDLGITDREYLSTEDINHRTNEGPVEVQIMTRRLCSEPLTVRVQRFFNQVGDKINYWWTNDEKGGAVDQTTLPPYALASLRETTGQLDEYMTKNAIKSWKEQIDRGDLHPIISDHFCFALRHYYQLDEEHKDRQLLLDLFTWRFALRKTSCPP